MSSSQRAVVGLLTVLAILAIATESSATYRSWPPWLLHFKDECDTCRSSHECRTPKCWNGKCVYDNSESMHKCFRDECEDCHSSRECITAKCHYGKCIYWTSVSFRKCFHTEPSTIPTRTPTPPPTPSPIPTSTATASPSLPPTPSSTASASPPPTPTATSSPSPPPSSTATATPSPSPVELKPLCANCKNAEECVQGYCDGVPRRCHDGTEDSLQRCFRPECAICRVDGNCASRKCKRKKCVNGPGKKESICDLLPECSKCNTGRECEQGNCFESSCTDGTISSLRRCAAGPPPTPSNSPPKKQGACTPCQSKHQCRAALCTEGLCGGPNRVWRCPKKDCARCNRRRECLSGKCWNNVCTDGSYESLVRCGFMVECGSCKSMYDCATTNCTDGRCIFDTRGSRKKCSRHQ